MLPTDNASEIRRSSRVRRRADQLLERAQAGDAQARQDFYQAMYGELRRRAASQMSRQGPDHTLQATALVNEAIVKIGTDVPDAWADTNHFLALASQAMRCVLVDHARAKNAGRRTPAAWLPHALTHDYESRALDMLILDEALARLEARDARMARIVELRFFGGLGMQEIAGVVGASLRTVEREWTMARNWLKRELS